MLRITVELIPHGNEQKAKKLAQMNIANIAGTEYSDYLVVAQERYDSLTQRHACLKNYPRWGASIWDMVGRASFLIAQGSEAPKSRPVSPPLVAVDGGMDFTPEAKLANPCLQLALEAAMSGSTAPLNGYYTCDLVGFLQGSRSPFDTRPLEGPSFKTDTARAVLGRRKKRKTSFRMF